MSITPVMEASDYQLSKKEEGGSIKRGGFSRQNSFGSSDDQSISVDNEIKGPGGQSRQESKKEISSKIVQNIYFQIFITFLTVLTLILYDVKTIACDKQQDFAIGVANCIFFVIFMVQICMNVNTEGYFCSFFFFLDLVSTITILFDVDFVTDAMFNQSSSFQVSSFVAQSKTSRVAARAVRVVKIFRLARVAKLYKSTQRAKELSEKNRLAILQKENNRLREHGSNQEYLPNNQQASNHNFISRQVITRKNLNTGSNLERYQIENDSIKEEHQRPEFSPINVNATKSSMDRGQGAHEGESEGDLVGKQSQISKILTEDTIKKIVIIILLIMIEIPLLSTSNFQNISTQWDLTTTFIANSLQNPNISLNATTTLIQMQISSLQSTSVQATFMCIDSPFVEISTCSGIDFTMYRTSDLGAFTQVVNTSAVLKAKGNLTLQETLGSQNPGDSIIIFVNYSQYNALDAGFSIATTTFVCLTIIYLLGSFSGNINDLVIIPIERMLALVRARDYLQEEAKGWGQEEKEEYETKLVQQAIVKIKGLMETIYGPLGNDLVQEKMLNNKSISANLMQSLKKSCVVAAVCKINHINKITEILGEDAFGLINQIAVVVHNAAFRYGGYCTKVLDQGFLIIFKVPEEQVKAYNIIQGTDVKIFGRGQDKALQTYINNFCDFSLYFALKALARVVKQPKLFKYRNDQRLLRGFGGMFNIEMNFSFTMGWCNEAVIGSSHKIDPLFLGEQINRLERLIRITHNYPSSILLTDSLYANLSPALKYQVRPFQAIKFSDAQEEKRVYFVDYDTSNVSPSLNATEKLRKQVKDLRTKKAMNMLYLSGMLKGDKAYSAKSFISRKKELSQILRKMASDETRRKRYEVTFEKYLKGEWAECQEFLQSENLKNDIPSQRLYNLLQASNFKVPEGWKGYRCYSQLF